jgi:hypothetical protein
MAWQGEVVEYSGREGKKGKTCEFLLRFSSHTALEAPQRTYSKMKTV